MWKPYWVSIYKWLESSVALNTKLRWLNHFWNNLITLIVYDPIFIDIDTKVYPRLRPLRNPALDFEERLEKKKAVLCLWITDKTVEDDASTDKDDVWGLSLL